MKDPTYLSSHLKHPEEPFMHKLEGLLHLGSKEVEDGEIGVFGAEKYFNGGIDEEINPRIPSNFPITYKHVEDDTVDIVPAKPKLQARTPSVHSESSWNSQTALFADRKPSNSETSKKKVKSLFSSLGCNCYCNDKNAVDIIDEQVVERNPKKITEVGFGSKKEISNSKAGNLAVKVNLQEHDYDEQRKSLEVFGSPVFEKKKKSLSVERRLAMLNWETSRRIDGLEIPGIRDGMSNDDYETASEASSDLFEIESFTNKLSSPASASACYAPSEASIEWSVVTASAADFSSMSDFEDLISSAYRKKDREMAPNARREAGKEMERTRFGILSGCKSQKAVGVAGDGYQTSGKAVRDRRRHHGSASFGPVTRLQAKTQQHGFDPHLLYIQ